MELTFYPLLPANSVRNTETGQRKSRVALTQDDGQANHLKPENGGFVS